MRKVYQHLLNLHLREKDNMMMKNTIVMMSGVATLAIAFAMVGMTTTTIPIYAQEANPEHASTEAYCATYDEGRGPNDNVAEVCAEDRPFGEAATLPADCTAEPAISVEPHDEKTTVGRIVFNCGALPSEYILQGGS